MSHTINGYLGRIIIDRKAEFTSIQVGHDAASFTTEQVKEVIATLAGKAGLVAKLERKPAVHCPKADPLWDRPAKFVEVPNDNA